MKLKFSSVQQPELVGYLALLKPQNVEIEEIVGYCDASLRTADQIISDRKSIALQLAQVCGNPLLTSAKNIEEEAKFDQIFSFAYGTIEPSCSSNHPDMFSVLEMLNEMLMKNAFLVGNELTAADALVFSLLHSRIRALIPSNQRKYFRVLRWFLQIQHEMAKSLTTIFVPGTFDLKALESSAVVPEKAMEKLSLEEAKERKKQQKAKKSEAAPVAAAAAVDVPVIGRVDLRVGKIVEIEKHPNADRLYIEKVDFGEAELRTVVSGLVEHVPIDDLKDRMCMFICNLKPASICKVQSTAMLLVAKNETQGLEPLIIPAGARPGDRICVAGVEAQPDAVIKPAKEPQMSVWDEVRKDLAVDAQGVAKYKDQVLQVVGLSEPIHSVKISTGLIVQTPPLKLNSQKAKMDLSQLPEKDRQKMVQYIEEKQAKQFLSLYSFLVTRCFDDCIDDFTSDTLSSKERECTRRCTSKMLKLTNRIGQQMAEKQMNPAAAINPEKP